MKRQLRVERLAQREERKVIKRVIYLSIITAILIVFIFTQGISLLAKFADLLSSVIPKKADSQAIEKLVPQAPRFDPIPEATNSARLTVSGFSEAPKISIFVNLDKAGETNTEAGKFKFEDITLKNGENEIKTKAIGEGGQESDFSQTVKVILKTQEPKLEIESPTDGQFFSGNNRIRVSGKVDSDAQVYANGFLASAANGGKFEVLVPVSEGETVIEIKAVDDAGNVKVEKRKVNFKK